MKLILIFCASSIVGVQLISMIYYIGVESPDNVDGKDSGNVFKPEELKPGPWVEMTKGSIWPKPAQQTSSDNYFWVDPQTFKFKVNFKFNSCTLNRILSFCPKI